MSLNNLIYVAGGLTKAIYCYDPVEDYWMHVQNTFSRQVIHTEGALDIPKVSFYVTILARNQFNPLKMASLVPFLPYFFICRIQNPTEEEVSKPAASQLDVSVTSPDFLFESSYSWRTV